jgi:hypothetical protein
MIIRLATIAGSPSGWAGARDGVPRKYQKKVKKSLKPAKKFRPAQFV